MPARILTERIYLRVLSATLPLCLLSSAASEVSKTPPQDYETPGPVNAEDFLPKSAFTGSKIFAGKTAENDGLNNTYRISAGKDERNVVGTAAALEYLRDFENVAELLAAYAQKAAALQSFRLEDKLICAVDQNGVLLVPVSLDYAIWTATVAQRLSELADLKNSDQNIKSVAIWTDGKASERVKTELKQRGIDYQSLSLNEGA